MGDLWLHTVGFSSHGLLWISRGGQDFSHDFVAHKHAVIQGIIWTVWLIYIRHLFVILHFGQKFYFSNNHNYATCVKRIDHSKIEIYIESLHAETYHHLNNHFTAKWTHPLDDVGIRTLAVSIDLHWLFYKYHPQQKSNIVVQWIKMKKHCYFITLFQPW